MKDPDGAPVRVGDMLAGKYRVEKVLGEGAMGVVVAALHVDLQERRAIKFMLPAMLADTEGVERFLREARAAVRLKSEHVAKVHDVGRLDTGAPYIVMEYLEGSDLKGLLEARGPLPITDAARYLLQACEAIAEAHSLGIVHRDLKPANLFVTRGANGAPCVKVLDFGIAKVMGGGGPSVEMTATAQLLGTPLYMSPEQMRGGRNADARSDVWALGVILYRMLTGRTPFAGSSVTEICAAVVGDVPDPPAMHRPDVPPALEALVMRCLEKSPAKRFANAAEFAAALAPFAQERPPAPAAPAPAAPAPLGLGQTVAMDTSAGPLPATYGPAARSATWSPQVAAYPAPPPAAPAMAAPPQVMAVAAAPPAAAPAPGQSTAHASTWTQPVAPAGPVPAPLSPSTPATAKGSSRGVVVAVIGLVLVVVGGAAFVGLRVIGSREAAPPAPSSTAAAAPASATAVASPPSAAPVAPASGTQAPSAAPVAAPSTTVAASAAPAVQQGPSHVPRPASVPAPVHKKDAFGNERR